MTIADIEAAARARHMRVVDGGPRRMILLDMRPRHSRDVRVYVQQARRWVRPDSHPTPAAGWRHRRGQARR